MSGVYGARVLLCFAAVCVSLAAGAPAARAQHVSLREFIHVYSEVYSVSEGGTVYLFVWFRRYPTISPERRTLERVTFDFTGHPVHFDADGRPVEIITNNFVSSASFFPDDDAQVFGFDARAFNSRGIVVCRLDLDRGPADDANPFLEDYHGGTIRFQFNGGVEIVATFDQQGSFGPRTAKAELLWMSPRPPVCVPCESRRCRVLRCCCR